jgi:hypothetical protein
VGIQIFALQVQENKGLCYTSKSEKIKCILLYSHKNSLPIQEAIKVYSNRLGLKKRTHSKVVNLAYFKIMQIGIIVCMCVCPNYYYGKDSCGWRYRGVDYSPDNIFVNLLWSKEMFVVLC